MFCPYCGHNVGEVVKFCGSCGKHIEFLAFVDNSKYFTNNIFKKRLSQPKYFRDSYSYNETLDILASKHKQKISLTTLKCRLKKELKGPGQHYGYRSMWQTLCQKHHLSVKRHYVMVMMAELDPSGVVTGQKLSEEYKTKTVQKDVYDSPGPNYTWHFDGYDKLKPYGLAISGCIDGYLRKVLWLVCGATNSNPAVIVQHYVQCGSEFGVIPVRLRTDYGIENGTMAAMHCALWSSHQDFFAGAASHMYGSSTTNQRIESWWSYFRKQRTQFWMDLLSDMREMHVFNGSHEHMCLVRFIFMAVLQRDLDECKRKWNTHLIRPVSQSRCPSGKPDVMYYLPHRFAGCDCGLAVGHQQLSQFRMSSTPDFCGDPHLQEYFEGLNSGFSSSQTWESRVENYIRLKTLAGL
ncbi:solute carrier family 15, member 5 [Sarotherodon galilaeus]